MNTLINVEINKYRGIDDLIIKDFSRINLFVGKNNSGMSSILESIFLLVGISNPDMLIKVNQMRGLNVKTTDNFKYLFNKLNFNNIPQFKGCFSDSKERNLKLTAINGKAKWDDLDNRNILREYISTDVSIASTKVSGIELDFSIKRETKEIETYKNSIIYNYPEFHLSQNDRYIEDLRAVYLCGNNNDLNTLSRYSEIVKMKKEEIVLNAIKLIDPNIESIHALPDGLYFSYKDIDELLPSNISGDGVRKFLSIITTIVERKNNIILIDEIENGLHYLVHKLLWRSIFSMLEIFDVQLFVSTHNIETLKCLRELLEEREYIDYQDKIAIYKLQKTMKSKIKADRYSYSETMEILIN